MRKGAARSIRFNAGGFHGSRYHGNGEPRGLRVTLASPIESGVSAPGSRRNAVVQLGQTAHAKLTRTRGFYPHGLIFH